MLYNNISIDNQENTLELSIEIKDLKNTDRFTNMSKTDSYVKVTLQNEETKKIDYEKISEVIWDTLNPKYITKFQLKNDIAEIQILKFEVQDTEENECSNGIPQINQERLIGTSETNFVNIIKSQGKKIKMNVQKNGQNYGELFIHCEPLNYSRDEQLMKFNIQIDNKNHENYLLCNCNPDPNQCLNFYKITEEGDQIKVQQTELQQLDNNNQLNQDIKIKSRFLDNGDKCRKIKLQLSYYYSIEEENILDELQFTVDDILRNINNKKTKNSKQIKINFKNSKANLIDDMHIEIINSSTQLDQIENGLNFNLIIGIDLTASNGALDSANSLHRLNSTYPHTANEQQKCLHAVTSILIHYDTDKLVPMYGFGCRIANTVSHCVPMFSHTPFHGLHEVVEGYRGFINNPNMMLSGPTNFSPILQELINTVKSYEIWNQYVMMFITDGEITDMEETVDAIVECSMMPISIVIIGVGPGEFAKMQLLDDDKGQLVSRAGKKPIRDTVQFVNFNDCNHNEDKLRRELLYEIPDQMLAQFKFKNIKADDVLKRNPIFGQIMNHNWISIAEITSSSKLQ